MPEIWRKDRSRKEKYLENQGSSQVIFNRTALRTL